MTPAPLEGRGPPSRALTLTAVFSSSLGVGLIFGFQPPLIAFVLSRLGKSAFAIGAITSASLIAVILCGPIYPRVIARFGLKPCIVAGILFAAAVLLAMPLSPTVPYWLTLRFLAGCALGLVWIASEIWMNNASGPQARGTVMGIYGTVFSIGTVAGPVLLEFTGTHGAAPFFVGSASLVLTLLPMTLLRHVTGEAQPTAAAGDREGPSSGWGVLRAAPIVMLAALVAGLVESADLTLLPLYGLRASFGEHAALSLVAVFMAGNVALQVPIGVLADRYGRKRLLGLCACGSFVGPLLLPYSLDTPVYLWPLLFVWGGTLYAFYSQGVALLGEAFPVASLTSANTMFVMVYCFGGVVGPSAGGKIMDVWPRYGLVTLVSAAALLMLIGIAAEAMLRRPQRASA
ncbi:MAG TPA: MFS transporter [Steroidobacteraceae bacterium]|nr:MFS transporter [Steroidobacteraceae bacterium]